MLFAPARYMCVLTNSSTFFEVFISSRGTLLFLLWCEWANFGTAAMFSCGRAIPTSVSKLAQ